MAWGKNELFLSSNGHLVDASSNLPQVIRNNHGAAIGDINNDGRADILVNDLMCEGNFLQVQNASGQFVSSPSLLPTLTMTYSWGWTGPQNNTMSALIDVNGDGWKDMILGATDGGAANSQVFLNKNGSFANSVPTNLPVSGVDKESILGIQPVDLNGDDKPDLVMSVTNGGDFSSFYKIPYVQLLVNDGNGNFHDETASRFAQSKSPLENQAWYKSVYVVDLNHDGYSDIVLDGTLSTSRVLLNDGTGKFTDVMDFPVGQTIAVGDVNSDGMMDIVSEGGDVYTVWYNNLSNQHVYKANFGGDSLLGSSGNDVFYARDGVDSFRGNGGVDTCVLSGKSSAYTLTKGASNSFTLHAATSTDTMTDIDRLQFSDKSIALDINGNGGQAYRMYQAAFDRKPDISGLGYWISAMDKGASLQDVALGFMNSAEFKALYGVNPTNAEFVTRLYNNVLHRAPEQGGFDYWTGLLDSGTLHKENVMTGFSESPENQAQVIGVIQNGMEYIPYV